MIWLKERTTKMIKNTTLEQVKNLLLEKMSNQTEKPEISINDMTGTGDHLEIHISSSLFKNKSILQQHRIVMDILKEQFDEGLHAIKLKTTPTKD